MPTILCFGDSNTHGTPPMRFIGDLGRYDRATRWPGVMAQALGPDWQVIEEGQPGRTTVHDDPIEGPHRNGLTVLPAILESHAPIDVLAIKLGTNDLKQRFGLTGQDIALGVRKLVDVARASDKVRLITLIVPPPVREAGCLAEIFSGAEARCAGIAAKYAAMAADRSISSLDAGLKIAVDPPDGIHYSAQSHGILGQAVAAHVVQIWQGA
jgi:lysophospholipase L1-like esterase